MDLISVIIPVFNAERYINRILECLKRQTYSNLEIIIVDDGSTDRSLELIKLGKINDNRIIIINAEHKGVGNARNLGIKKARGEYISFLDVDDYIEYEMYEKIINKVKEKNADLLRYNYTFEDSQGNPLKCNNDFLKKMDLVDTEINSEYIRSNLLSYIFKGDILAYSWLIIVKTDLIKNLIEYKTDLSMMEDLIFYLELFLKIGRAYFYDYKGYHYVCNSSSASRSRSRLCSICYDIVKVINYIVKILKEYNIDENMLSLVYYKYTNIFIQYLVKIFCKIDEYTISYEQMIKLIDETKIVDILKKANYSNCPDENMKTMVNYLKNKQFEKFYESANNEKIQKKLVKI